MIGRSRFETLFIALTMIASSLALGPLLAGAGVLSEEPLSGNEIFESQPLISGDYSKFTGGTYWYNQLQDMGSVDPVSDAELRNGDVMPIWNDSRLSPILKVISGTEDRENGNSGARQSIVLNGDTVFLAYYIDNGSSLQARLIASYDRGNTWTSFVDVYTSNVNAPALRLGLYIWSDNLYYFINELNSDRNLRKLHVKEIGLSKWTGIGSASLTTILNNMAVDFDVDSDDNYIYLATTRTGELEGYFYYYDGKAWSSFTKVVDRGYCSRVDIEVITVGTTQRILYFYARPWESSALADGDLYMKYSDNLGSSWSTETRVMDDRNDYSTVICINMNGTLAVFTNHRNGATFYDDITMSISRDNGVTWSNEVTLISSRGLNTLESDTPPDDMHVVFNNDIDRLYLCYENADDEINMIYSDDWGSNWISEANQIQITADYSFDPRFSSNGEFLMFVHTTGSGFSQKVLSMRSFETPSTVTCFETSPPMVSSWNMIGIDAVLQNRTYMYYRVLDGQTDKYISPPWDGWINLSLMGPGAINGVRFDHTGKIGHLWPVPARTPSIKVQIRMDSLGQQSPTLSGIYIDYNTSGSYDEELSDLLWIDSYECAWEPGWMNHSGVGRSEKFTTEPIELENGQTWPDTLMMDVYNLDSTHTIDVGIIDPVNETYYTGFDPGGLSLISQPSSEKTTIVQWTSTFLRDLPEWARAIQLEIRLVGSGTSPPMGVHRVWMTDNLAPEVIGITADPGYAIYRTNWVEFSVQVEDDLERTDELLSQMFYKKPGSVDWETDGLTKVGVDENIITWNLSIPYNAEVGEWELMVNVTDTLDANTGDHVFTEKLMVMNNIPSAPTVEISPGSPRTEDDITVSVTIPGMDVETGTMNLKYSYEWYLNGKLHTTVNTSELSSIIQAELTTKGDTWMVKVYTVDDLNRSDFDTASVLVINTAPHRNGSWGPLYFDEDTPIGPMDLNDVFYDVDEDELTFNAVMDNWLTYEIDDDMLTIEPGYNWNGEFTVNITATDGELHNFMVVEFVVESVNDLPLFEPVEDMTAAEDEWFNYTFRAWDPADLEEVTVTMNITDEVAGLIEGENYRFDEENSTLWLLPDNDMVGVYHINITFTDEYGGFVWTNVVLTIENVNDPPTGVIMLPTTNNLTINKGDNVTFMASGEDVDDDEVSFYWVQKGGTSEVTLGEGEEMTYAFTIPGIYNVVCVVSDGKKEASIGKVIVNVLEPVLANSEPHDIVLDASIDVGGLDQETAAEVLTLWESSRSVRADIPLVLTASAIDDDDDELTFTWSHEKSAMWVMSGATVTINPNELTPDTYVFTVSIDDGAGHVVTDTMSPITVLWTPSPQVDDDDDDGIGAAGIVITAIVFLFWLIVVAAVIIWLMIRKKKDRELGEKDGVAETGITMPSGPPKKGEVMTGVVTAQQATQQGSAPQPAPAPEQPSAPEPAPGPASEENGPEQHGPPEPEMGDGSSQQAPKEDQKMQEPPEQEGDLPPGPPPAPEAPPVQDTEATVETSEPPSPPDQRA